uniref:Calmodulin-binding transcription activator 2 n=1 Tax=Cynoglossus semilaevis TaxID=244447 RepID=A0A3P8V1I5_CYNSE
MSNKEMVSPETENKGQRKVFLPNKLLECLPRSTTLPNERLRWNTNEEIASYLISFDRHEEWLSCTLKTRPKNGSIILYNRKKVKYRKDGYCWKKRKDGKTTREDHMKLKVQGMECLYGCYVHSSIVPTFHRRCYWLLQNPDIVLVHYLNVPSLEDSGKCSPLLCAVSDRHDSVRWSRDDLLSQLKPMFHSMKCSLGTGDFSIEELVQHILERQRPKPQPRTHTCLCNTAQVSPGVNIPHRCNSTKHRIISPKLPAAAAAACTPSPSPLAAEAGEAGRAGGPGEAKLPHLQAQSSPASSPSSISASSPPRPHRAPTIAVSSHNNSFYGDHRPSLTTVALPQNAVIVMATTTAIPGGRGVGSAGGAVRAEEVAASQRRSLSLTHSGQLLLSSTLPPAALQASVAPPLLPLCLELGGLGENDMGRQECEKASRAEEIRERRGGDDDEEDDEGQAPPTKLALLQPSRVPSSLSPRQTGNGSSSLLLVCQETPPTNNQTQQHTDAQPPLVLTQPYTQQTMAEVPPPNNISHQPLLQQMSIFTQPKSTTDLVPLAPPNLAPPPVQVKEESRHEREDDSIDMALDEDDAVASCEQAEEELDISFDSQFPDLISELITEEANPVTAHPPASAATTTAPTTAMFPAVVRYVVPPQPSPSSSFLPFPHPLPSSSSTRPASITDFSPEWSYPEGGVKVLITGPWNEQSGRYACVFDQSSVPASLIQPGVLRCYCPAHEAGLVCLQVLESGGSVSSSVLFEYRARNASSLPSSQLDWLSLDDNQFRMSILERLEQMERRMAEMAARDNNRQHQQHYQQHGNRLASLPPPAQPEDHEQWFERRIVGVCERMMRVGRWGGGGGGGAGGEREEVGGGERLQHSVRHRGMTLLHLAAAQGYTHLIQTLIYWRSINADSLDLEQEVDPLNVDHFSCTPLMWACALGHQRAAELLYGWNSLALGIPDSLGRLPLAVARSRGHTRLASALEGLHVNHPTSQTTPPSDTQTLSTDAQTPATPQPQLPLSPLSTSPDTGLSSSSSIPSPSDPSSPSPSSAYSSGPTPMDTSPSSPSSNSSPSSSPPSASSFPSVSMWGEEPNTGFSSGVNAGSSREFPLYLMDYESASPCHAHIYTHTASTSGRRLHTTSSTVTLEEELLSYSENAENEGEEEEYLEEEVLQVDMAVLAEQIIEATPERIKQEDFPRGAESPLRERRDNPAIQDTWLATYLDTVDVHTHSPPRRVCPPSPLSALALQRLRPPSSAAWAEFLNASANGKMERDFALLTLTDGEQRELYEAARVIQNAFRRYKGRRLKEQQDMAAAVIQRCYRKYKQYALYKKMTQAAILIQSKFRSYYEQKRFQQSRRAAVLIQQYYRSYKQAPRGGTSHSAKMKGSFLTKKQDQAARKIMRFLRRCRHRIKELKQTRELERRGLTTL